MTNNDNKAENKALHSLQFQIRIFDPILFISISSSFSTKYEEDYASIYQNPSAHPTRVLKPVYHTIEAHYNIKRKHTQSIIIGGQSWRNIQLFLNMQQ